MGAPSLQSTVIALSNALAPCCASLLAVLASANPVGSRYNPQLSVVENIQLPPSLMSRFDLIYLVRGWVCLRVELGLFKGLQSC